MTKTTAHSFRAMAVAVAIVAFAATTGTRGDAQERTRTPAGPAAQTGTAAQTDDETRLIEWLQVHEGSIVGEIGAGAGKMTLAMSRRVGPAGRVYATELGDDRIASLRRAIETAGVQNVTVLEGDPVKTNMPEACCDALYMQNVYHHFEDPSAMNASLWRSLKPGGRVAIEDFSPNKGGEAARPEDRDTDPYHGVRGETVQRELQQAGFEEVTVENEKQRGFLVVARKPVAPPAGAASSFQSAAQRPSGLR